MDEGNQKETFTMKIFIGLLCLFVYVPLKFN